MKVKITLCLNNNVKFNKKNTINSFMLKHFREKP